MIAVLDPPRTVETVVGVERFLADADHVGLTRDDGRTASLPSELVDVLRAAAEQMRDGHSVSVVPVPDMMSTREAADFLGFSRPTVVRLIDSGRLPAIRAKSHRSLRREDVIAYRENLARERRQLLAEMSKEATKDGMRSDGFVTTR